MQHIIGISSRRLRISTLALLLPAMSWAADTASLAVGPQYDTTHVYVERGKMDAFVDSILKTFGGTSTERVLVNVTPTPSETYSQLILTPAGSFSVFDFNTPIPHPFGTERNGFLVRDMDAAIRQARAAGADVQVAPFDDPIGRDAVIQWPGGVNMQLYWHTKAPNYKPLLSVPENRLYLSAYRVDDFLNSYRAFSHAKVATRKSAMRRSAVTATARSARSNWTPASAKRAFSSPTGICLIRSAMSAPAMASTICRPRWPKRRPAARRCCGVRRRRNAAPRRW